MLNDVKCLLFPGCLVKLYEIARSLGMHPLHDHISGFLHSSRPLSIVRLDTQPTQPSVV